MIRLMVRISLLLLLIPCAWGADYQRDVRPLLARRCIACHGPDEHGRQANLRLDTWEGATGKNGGYAGIVPGNSAASRVVARILDDQRPMPPVGLRLKPEEVEIVRKWIDEGAKYTDHWAFQKPVKAVRPEVRNGSWPRTEIDRYILARLEKQGLSPSGEADAFTLARRVALDLTGLPPDAADAEAFARDKSGEAYGRFVDKLLQSPHYGERWARMWLDLARYADTQGYEKDNRRIIWPYRDWVVRAFNENMPFDRFTILQLAGDLLPSPSEDQLIATGFHRNTMTNTEGGTDDEEFRDAAVKDRVAVTGQVWMGLTTGCAQCHTHKYDPISHKEFYQLYAFFNQSEDADRADDQPLLKLTSASTLIMRDLPAGKRRTTRIHERGNFLNPGAEVGPAVLGSFHPFPEGAPANRLGLAQWLVDRNNPLTARVMVNRLWARLFGAGLVESEEDFGTQGTPPLHQDVLDYLAVDFMEHGWDVKGLLKTMVMSAAYRQSSAATAAAVEKDPRNRYLGRGARFRLDAEAVRDQALAVSGLLSRKMYGPPVMPWQPDGIWMVVYNGERWVTSEGEDRYRRGLYTFMRRTSPYPSMITYDAPSGEVCTIRRIRTNTPLQALASMNDPVSMEAAQRLALRTLKESSASDIERAEHMFRLVLVRPPSRQEVHRLLALHKDAASELRKNGASQNKLVNYDRTMYPEDRDVVLVDDARGAAPEWKYITSEPAAGWNAAGFDASGWQSGKGQFGQFARNPPSDAKIATAWDTENLWMRIEFDSASAVEGLRLLVRSGAHFDAFLNGVPAASTNLDRSNYYEYPLGKEASSALRPGKNVLAIHAIRSSEKQAGQLIDASLHATRPLSAQQASSENAKRAAWVVVANAILNLDETVTRR